MANTKTTAAKDSAKIYNAKLKPETVAEMLARRERMYARDEKEWGDAEDCGFYGYHGTTGWWT